MIVHVQCMFTLYQLLFTAYEYAMVFPFCSELALLLFWCFVAFSAFIFGAPFFFAKAGPTGSGQGASFESLAGSLRRFEWKQCGNISNSLSSLQFSDWRCDLMSTCWLFPWDAMNPESAALVATGADSWISAMSLGSYESASIGRPVLHMPGLPGSVW